MNLVMAISKPVFSNYGKYIDVFATYYGISTDWDSNFNKKTKTKITGGTSAAAPIVAGVATLIMSDRSS